MRYLLILIGLLGLGLAGLACAAPPDATGPGPTPTTGPVVKGSVDRLAQGVAPITAPPGVTVSVALGVTYIYPGERMYEVRYMDPNDQGRICLSDGIAPPACAPLCNASPCTLWVPARQTTLPQHLTLLLAGTDTYFNATIWDWQVTIHWIR